MRVVISSIFLSIVTIAFPASNSFALDFQGLKPSGAGSSLAKSDTSDVALDLTRGDFDLNVDGEKAKLFFSDSESITHEALLGVYLKKKNKKGRVVKKFYTAEQAREQGICAKKKARGLYYFTQSVNEGFLLDFSAVRNSDDTITHFELTEITGLENLKKSLKRYTSKKKGDLAKLDNDCNRADGIGW